MGEHLRQLKGALRSALRAERRSRRPEEVACASREISGSVLRLAVFHHPRRLGAYAAGPGEVDPAELVQAAVSQGLTVYFPRVVEPTLEFLACPPAGLRPGAFGLAEPPGGHPLDSASSDVLFLVPGLAFDPSGTRLGRGGGHYDRALADHRSAMRIGLACVAVIQASIPPSTS